MDFATLFAAENLVVLLTLTALEIVLGVDNIIFIAILVGKLPAHQRDKARKIGLFLAMFMRIALLFAITWVMKLDKYTLFTYEWPAWLDLGGSHGAQQVKEGVAAVAAEVRREAFTGKDLVLFLGGLFLVAKSTYEIHHKIEDAGAGGKHEITATPKAEGATDGGVSGGYVKSAKNVFGMALVQILLLDLVFSIDSVITAVGMTQNLPVMITAVVVSVGVMLAVSGAIARFVDRHPTIKMLALAFLILIGVMLIAESTGTHVPKGYIYFAMAFSLGVEMLNIWVRARQLRKAAAKA